MTFSVNCFQGSLFVLVWLGSEPSHWALWVGWQWPHHPGDQGPVLAKCVDHRLSHQTTLLRWRPHGLYRILLLWWDWQIQSVWKWSCWLRMMFVCHVCVHGSLFVLCVTVCVKTLACVCCVVCDVQCVASPCVTKDLFWPCVDQQIFHQYSFCSWISLSRQK